MNMNVFEKKEIIVFAIIIGIMISSVIYFTCPKWMGDFEFVSICLLMVLLNFIVLYDEENVDNAFNRSVLLTVFLPAAIALIGTGMQCRFEAIVSITVATAVTAALTNVMVLIVMAFEAKKPKLPRRLYVVLGATPDEARAYAESFVFATFKMKQQSIVINERDSAIPDKDFWVLLIDNENPQKDAAESKTKLIKSAKDRGYYILGVQFSQNEEFSEELFDLIVNLERREEI